MAESALPARRFRLDLAYDGRPFAGWHSQPDGNTIQDIIGKALSTIQPGAGSLHGSGRTDAGVCAFGQVAHFDAPPASCMGGDDWQRALNAHLPPTIRVMSCREVDPAFHARFSAIDKTYDYEIVTGPVLPPLRHGLAWHQRGLPLDELASVLARYPGTRDFRPFAAKRHDGHDEVRDTVRTVFEASVRPTDDQEGVVLRFRGDGFLYKMVRFLVGTAVYVCRGRITGDDLAILLSGKDPNARAPYCAPAAGLTLVSVTYPESFDRSS